MALSTGSIVGIVFSVVGFLVSVAIRLYFDLRKERKRDAKEKAKEAKEREDLEKGKSDGSSPTIVEQGLTSKPELEGSMVGAVVPKMELDSQPISELGNTMYVRELDGTSIVGQPSEIGTGAARKEDGIRAELPTQKDFAHELPG
ncbi:hypothetical protein F4781DRAFT_429092 [Annulohypoxylon bovei var. microspora]|nr:hypothetical protein F4781DRAFT_429092 [Annulohypoxylon bovei var. microspora]